VSKGKFILITS